MRCWIKWLLATLLLSSLLLIAGWHYVTTQVDLYLHQPVQISHAEVVQIESGTSVYSLSRDWIQKGWLKPTDRTRWLLWLQPKWRKIRAGSYEIKPEWDYAQALEHIISGQEHQFSITFVEGSRWREWQQQLNRAPELTALDEIRDQSLLLKSLNIDAPRVEGWLYPDTYYYTAETSALTVVKWAHMRMQEKLKLAWQQRDPAVNQHLESPYQALILASIIEKETGKASERKTISSVFHNRFDKKMRLQTDPTVIYGMGESYRGNITRADLRRKTPYNTYVIKGLPPTPIAMPGIAAIEAALQPEQSNYYYFVSRGDGSHAFSSSLKEHNRNVRKYILKRSS